MRLLKNSKHLIVKFGLTKHVFMCPPEAYYEKGVRKFRPGKPLVRDYVFYDFSKELSQTKFYLFGKVGLKIILGEKAKELRSIGTSFNTVMYDCNAKKVLSGPYIAKIRGLCEGQLWFGDDKTDELKKGLIVKTERGFDFLYVESFGDILNNRSDYVTTDNMVTSYQLMVCRDVPEDWFVYKYNQRK